MSSARTKRLFGRAIKALCDRPGFSQQGLAEYLDVDEPYVSNICAGKIWPAKFVDKIPEYLKVPTYRLFKEDPLSDLDEPAPPKAIVPDDLSRVSIVHFADLAGFEVKLRKKRSPKPVKKN